MAYFRKIKGLSQEDIANRLGKSRTTITMYESGKIEPTASMLFEIAKVLDVTVFDLLIYSEYDQDRLIKYEESIDISLIEDLKSKINHSEAELILLKRELSDKIKIIALHEKRESEYEKRLTDIKNLYDKIVKRLS